uniref:Phospholipid scramblase n=1 Tax=Varanus komodoensis TaxID=61221 RepID=A0A8D2LE31_VARKO
MAREAPSVWGPGSRLKGETAQFGALRGDPSKSRHPEALQEGAREGLPRAVGGWGATPPKREGACSPPMPARHRPLVSGPPVCSRQRSVTRPLPSFREAPLHVGFGVWRAALAPWLGVLGSPERHVQCEGPGGSVRRTRGRGPSPAVPPDARLGPSPPAFLGFEGKNRYEVRNTLGQPVFRAEEQSDCCTRHCCGSLRRFSLRLDDPAGREVLRMVRPLKCVSCWFPCCLQELEVQCPPGTTIGFVQQTWHPFTPKFSIQNVEKETVLRVLGPCFACSCGGDVNFEVKTRDESRGVGRIAKQWSGLVQEVFTDTDNFGVQFPMDLDVKIKAVLLGACFLITRGKGRGGSPRVGPHTGLPGAPEKEAGLDPRWNTICGEGVSSARGECGTRVRVRGWRGSGPRLPAASSLLPVLWHVL